MAHHQSVQEAFGQSVEELAEKIGNLRYDNLAVLLEQLYSKVAADSAADESRGRTLLSTKLWELAWQLKDAHITTAEIWNICKPFMQK